MKLESSMSQFVLLYNYLVERVHIEPDIRILDLLYNTSHTVECFGNEPVTWRFKQHANFGNETGVKYGRFKYESTFTLEKVSDSDVGDYYCGLKNNSGSKYKEDSKSIHIKILHLQKVNNQTYNTYVYSDESNQNQTDSNSSSVIFYTLLTTFIITVLGCIILLIQRKNQKNKTTHDFMMNFQSSDINYWNPSLSVNGQADLLPYDKKWEFPVQKLKLGKQLGSGAYGLVFKATAIGITDENTATTVAVKMIKPTTDPRVAKALVSELKIMVNLGRHLNIVNLLGACTGRINEKLIIIVEYCSFGCIHQYLLNQRDCFINQLTSDGLIDHNIKTSPVNPNYENVINIIDTSNTHDSHSSQIRSQCRLDDHELDCSSNYEGDCNDINIKPISTCDLINWSFQISRGMDYLSSKKIIHGDLAARNVLLTDGNIVKICDFGLSKNIYYSDVYKMKSKKNLPVKWMAIESLVDLVFSTKSDIWSFGIVLWELFSLAATPYPNIEFFDLVGQLVEGYRMNRPKYANSEIYDIMSSCWDVDPSKRPSFSELAARLGTLLQLSTKVEYAEVNITPLRESEGENPKTDFISFLTEPNNSNCTVTNDNRNNLHLKNDECPDRSDNLELIPLL